MFMFPPCISVIRLTLARALCVGHRVLPSSSLITGSRSHKVITSDVSRILRGYYNDPVSQVCWHGRCTAYLTDMGSYHLYLFRQSSSSSALATNSSTSRYTSSNGTILPSTSAFSGHTPGPNSSSCSVSRYARIRIL